jgi:hypothetical protein
MSAYGGHPGRKTIAAYLARTAGAADRLWVDEHLQHCIWCYRVMAEERFPEARRAPVTVCPVPAAAPARAPGGLSQRIAASLVRTRSSARRQPATVTPVTTATA